jgi:thiol-disulfide isomerase/thioredoxin
MESYRRLACALGGLAILAAMIGPGLPPARAQTQLGSGGGDTVKAGATSQSTSAGTLGQALMVGQVDIAGLKRLIQHDPRGAHPLLVTFWATWCEPCREEFPDLISIDDQYRPRGLDYITVSMDDASEIKTTVPQYLQQMRARMPAYLLDYSEPEAVIAAVDPAWDGGLPATFLFDPRGQIVFKHVGRIKPADLRTAIERQIGSK